MSGVGIGGQLPAAAAGVDAASLELAMRALGAGVASIDGNGNLLSVDDRFLLLHGIDVSQGDVRGRLLGRLWSHVLKWEECRLAGEDAAALTARWTALVKAQSATGVARATLRLTDGRTLDLAVLPAGARAGVLAVRDSSEAAETGERRLIQRGFVHDVNNTLGGMLANLYLATSDLEADHPARQWLDAVNLAAVELRARIREIAGTASAKARPARRPDGR